MANCITADIYLKRVRGESPNVDFADNISVGTFEIENLPDFDSATIHTKGRYSTTDNANLTDHQLIQTHKFALKKIISITTEGSRLKNLEIADWVQVVPVGEFPYMSRVHEITFVQLGTTRTYNVEIILRVLAADPLAIANHLTAAALRSELDAVEGYLLDSQLNKLTITTNPIRGAARADGNEPLLTGFDFSADNKDFDIDLGSGVVVVTIKTNAANHAAYVTAIDAAFSTAGIASDVEAFDGNSFIGIRRKVALSANLMTLAAGSVDDALILLGITPAVYGGNFAIDEDFESTTPPNKLTFYTKLVIKSEFEKQSENFEMLEGKQIAINTNRFILSKWTFVLDNNKPVLGIMTEYQTFMFYVGSTFYNVSPDVPAGEIVTDYLTVAHRGVEVLEIDEEPNDELINIKVVTITMKEKQLYLNYFSNQ